MHPQPLDLPAARRPLLLRRRSDLIVRQRETTRGREWVVKDPLALRYFILSDAEHALWTLLDGQVSSDQLREEFACRFAPQQLSATRLQEYLIRLFRQGLIVSTRAGQGEQLQERRRRRDWQALLLAPLKILAWRLRGIDPEPYLANIYPRLRWIFHPFFLTALVLLVGAAIATVFVQWHELVGRLPQIREVFRADNLLLLALSLAIVKILHELGHAFACKHFGGEVRELGIMFLFFTPCLYCDVSDAWLFPRRRDRLAVSAAGMGVEVVLAALATLIWTASQPGVLNSLCLNIMVVCGFSTLLINGNPLMRYDGYYLLADACEIANLDEQAQTRLRRFWGKWLLGINLPSDQINDGRANFVLVYAIFSTVYRLAILVGVAWMLHQFLKPARLEVLATLAASLALGGFFAGPLLAASAQWTNPLARRRLHAGKITLRLAFVLAVGMTLVLIPWPRRVSAPAVLEASRTQFTYATAPGRLVESLPAGTNVAPQQILVRLANPDLDRTMAQLSADEQRLMARMRNLETLRADDPTAAGEIPTTQKLLDDVRERLAQLADERRRLEIRATQAGLLVDAPNRPDETLADSRLAAWSGSLLEHSNRGAWVEAGTLVARVIDPRQWEAVAVVDQADVALLAVGQPASIYLRQLPYKRLSGVVSEVSQMQIDQPPPQLVGDGEVLVATAKDGSRQPLTPSYQVRIELSEPPQEILLDGRCSVRVVVSPQSLATRWYHYFRRTFR
jgi:putative peptide zinc metalloprotease protein